MKLGTLRRWSAAISVLMLVLLCALLLAQTVSAQGTQRNAVTSERPGDAVYAPTKLEWAALELQANFGREWTRDDHVAVSYMQEADGRTVRCVLQYTPDVSAQALRVSRDVVQVIFDKYQAARGWPWLRLAFDERPLPAPH